MPASNHQSSKQGSGHRHPTKLRERAVRMVHEAIKETGERHGVVTRVAYSLDWALRRCTTAHPPPRTLALAGAGRAGDRRTDRGVQYLASRYTERLAESGAVRSVGYTQGVIGLGAGAEHSVN